MRFAIKGEDEDRINSIFAELVAKFQDLPDIKPWRSLCMMLAASQASTLHDYLMAYPFIGNPGGGDWRRQGVEIDNGQLWYASIPVEEVDVTKVGIGRLTPRLTKLAHDAAAFMVPIIRRRLAYAQSDEFGACYDGQPLVSEAHEWGGSGQQSNVIRSTGKSVVDVARDWNRGLAIAAGWKTEHGEFAIADGSFDTAIVSPDGELIGAFNTLKNEGENGGRFALGSTVRQVLVCPELGASGDWFMVNASGTYRPFVYLERRVIDLFLREKDLNSHVFVAQASGSFALGDPSTIIKATNAPAD